MTEMEIALLAALVKLIDGHITPLQTRIKCWKTKKYSTGNKIKNGEFELGMIIPQFEGPDDILYWFIPYTDWNKFNVIELEKAPESSIHHDEQLIKAVYRI